MIPDAGGSWVDSTAYAKGDKVTYNELSYIAKWGQKGKVPGETNAWTVVIAVVEGTWDATAIYVGGDSVIHNGEAYTAAWWTQGNEPGTNSVWVLD